MKKNSLVLLYLFSILVIPALGAQEGPGDIDALLDFSVTLKDIGGDEMETGQKLLENPRYLIIEGSVVALTPVENDPETMELELIGGEWTEDCRIRAFRRLVRVPGGEAKGGKVRLHDHLVVLGYLTGYRSTGNETIPVINGRAVRVIP